MSDYRYNELCSSNGESMTPEQKSILDSLRFKENILSQSYWENFKFYKELAQGVGGKNPKAIKIGKGCEDIREEWNACKMQINEFLHAIGEKEE